jgi:hypothetical protein
MKALHNLHAALSEIPDTVYSRVVSVIRALTVLSGGTVEWTKD